MSLIGSAAPLQTNPALAYEVADRNALYASAPDPQQAAERQLAEWMAKFAMTRGGGGGPGGGTGAWAGAAGGTPRSSPSFSGGGGGTTTGTSPLWHEYTNPPALYGTGTGPIGYWDEASQSYVYPGSEHGVSQGSSSGDTFDWSNPDNYYGDYGDEG